MNAFTRERVVIDYMRRVPGVIEPETALAAVVWPSSELLDFFPTRYCKGCGADHSAYTEGCRHCYQRHYARRSRGESAYFPVCKGCGCDIDSRTLGCRTCKWRAQTRRRRAKKEAA